MVSKKLVRLKKIEEVSEVNGVYLDDEAHDDVKQLVTSSESSNFLTISQKDSFPSLFWQQQVEAASKKSARNMRWHLRWPAS